MAEGELPICLVAHMDTVFPTIPQKIYYDQEETTLWSPQGLGADDRAGIFAIVELLDRGCRPSIIFTDLEEKGGIGASALVKDYFNCPFEKCNALIQLDRAGENDAVYYDCDNKSFEEWITCYGFITSYGSFSDISVFGPEWGIAAVNLSVGYEDEHSYVETLNVTHLYTTINKVEQLLIDIELYGMDFYEYIPFEYPQNKFTSFLNHSCVNCNKSIPYGEGYWCDPADRKVKICNECYDEIMGNIKS